MKSRRGISEIISALIIIAVVVAGMGLYVGVSQQRILGETASVKEVIEQRQDQITELVEFITFVHFLDKYNNDIVGVFVHNHGLKDITISNAFVNNFGIELERPKYHVRDLGGKIISPSSNTIPFGKTVEIILNFSDSSQTKPFYGIQNLVILTDSNKFIQFVNDTQ